MKVGLFGTIWGGTVRNLGVINASVKMSYDGAQSYASILCGGGYSVTIKNCFVRGTIDAENTRTTPPHNVCVGMLVGCMKNSSTITNSFAEGSVSGKAIANSYKAFVGGLVGLLYTPMEIRNCYFVGNVTSYSTSNSGYAGYL